MKRSHHSSGRSPARRVLIPRTVVGLAAAAMVAPFLATVTPQVSAAPGDEQVQILSFNDYHGHVEPGTAGSIDGSFGGAPAGGGEYLSAKLTELRDASTADDSFTVAAGDLIGGSPFFSGLFHDEPSVESLNEMDLDYSGVGNHEFDEGTDELIRMQNGGCFDLDGDMAPVGTDDADDCYFPSDPYPGANFQWLAANVTEDAPDGTNDFEDSIPDWWIDTTAGGNKIAFIGMTLEDTDELVAAAGIAGFTFEDEITAGDAAVAAIKLADPTVETMVLMLHEGGIPNPFAINGCAGVSGPINTIAEGMNAEIDAIISGHTHEPYTCSIDDPANNPRPVTSAFSFGRVVTEINLEINNTTGEVDRSTFTMLNHEVLQPADLDDPQPGELVADPAVTAVIDKWTPLAEAQGNVPVGEITETITRGGDPTGSDRGVESAAGNLVADAQWASTQTLTPPADVAFMNPGGLRSDLEFPESDAMEGDGVVTFGEAFTFQPFNNTMFVLPMTGEQIVKVLEEQCQPGGSSRPFLHLGVSEGFTYDMTNTLQGGTCTDIEITNVMLNGMPLVMTDTYQVAVNNFLADGGDNFDTFADVDPTDRTPGGQDIDALTDYFAAAGAPVPPPSTDRVSETRTILPGSLESVVPARLLDTRIGDAFSTIDGEFLGSGRLAAGTEVELVVTGRGEVDEDAIAAVLNIGAVFPSEKGFITVYPCGDDRPLTSNVNYPKDGVVSNLMLAKLDEDGEVCIYTSQETNLYIDVNGFVPFGGTPLPLLPARLMDTRPGDQNMTTDGEYQGDGPIAEDTEIELEVAGRGGVPEGTTAVSLNVGVVAATEPGFITVYSCDGDLPLASSVNFAAGQTVSNSVNALVNDDGNVCVYASKTVNVIVDVNATVPEGGSPIPLVPARLIDTRTGDDNETVDGEFEGQGPLEAGGIVKLDVAGRGEVPDDATAVTINVGAVRASGPGYLTIFPCGTDQPFASSVNYRGDDVISNSVVAQIGDDGQVCIYTLQETDLIADVTGAILPVMPFFPGDA